MKKLTTTRPWILLCYILAVTNASTGHGSHVIPNHGHPRSILSAVPPTIRIPEKILPRLEDVSCVSANINIFDILNEAKQYSKGNDLHIKLYYYSNQKYYAIGEINVNKELFDRILMKYDDWLITGERISDNNTVTNLPDHILNILKDKVKNANETAKGTDKITDLVAPDNQNNRLGVDEVLDSYRNSQKNNDVIDSQAFDNNRETLPQEKNEKFINTAESKDNIEDYLKLNPKYDDKNKYFEVSLPKDGTEGKESTINLEIDNGRNNFPYIKEKQNEPDNALENNLLPTAYKEENETNVMTQTVTEYGKTYVHNESVNNNNEVGTSVNTDFASETNDGKPQIYSTKYETIVNNKQNVVDSESNNDIIKSSNFKGNMPNIINSYKTNNDRSMQNDQGSNLKQHLNLNDRHKKGGNHDVSHSLKHEDKNHITEVLHHNPNENIYNPDDIFEEHVSKLGLQINGENPYIYNPHDFEDTHEITLQDKDENHIHLNEKVYKIHELSSESDHKNGSYTIKIPKSYSSCPQTLLQNDHEPDLDSSGPNQPSQLNVEDSLTSNLVIPPIGNNMDSGELSRSMKSNSQAQASTSSVQDVPKYYKEDFTKQSPLDTNLGYQSLPNSCQDSFRLLSSPLNNIQLLNTDSQNTPLNLGYTGFPSYSQLNNPSIRLVPNKKLFTDCNAQQSDLLPNINHKKFIVDSESICNNNMISETDINANHKHPSFVVGSKDCPFKSKQPLEASSMPIKTTFELSSPHQSSILDGTHSSIFDKPTLGIDSSISNIPCSSEIGMVPPNSEALSPNTNHNLESLKSSMDAIPKDVYIQTLLDIIKQHPYVLNPKLIQQYVPNLSPVSQQVCQTPASSSPLSFEEIKPNLSFSADNIKPNSQLLLNLLWNNPRQYMCPSNIFPNPSTYPFNLQRYPAQKSAIGIPQFKNLQIPSPLVLNNNFNHHDSTGSQKDVLEPSLVNAGSIINKPLNYEPYIANLPSQLLPSERPLSFNEIGNGPCFNLPSNEGHLIKPNQQLTPLSKIPAELIDQTSHVNTQLLPNEIPTEHEITYLDNSPSPTANKKLNKAIQSANLIEDIRLNPTDSIKKYAPIEYLDSSLLPPSILTPCLNNAFKSPLLFPSTKLPNFLQEPNYLDSSLLPPSIPLPCFNPELESQKAIYITPQNKQFKLDDSIPRPSRLNLKPIPSKLANHQAVPHSYLDSSLIPPSLSPYFTSEFKTQPDHGISQYGTDSQITELPDYIQKQLSALGLKPTVHLQPKTSSHISPSQEYLESKFLPHNVFSPCFNSEIKTPPSFQDILSQSGAQTTELIDYLSHKPLILNPMMYSRPKVPKFIQVPPLNYLDSSLLPPSLNSPYLNNVIEAPINIEDITQYGSDSQFKLADLLSAKTSPGQKPTLHVPPITANYVPTTQEYLGNSLLPPNILSPCLKSEIDTLSSLSNIQSLYQPGDNVSKKLIPSSLHPMLPKIGKYIGPPVDYLDSTLLPPSILPPCNTGIQTSPSMESSNYYSEGSTGVENDLKQRPLTLKQPTKYSHSHQTAIKGSIDNVEKCNTPLDAMSLNHYPMLTLQNSEIIRGPSPCAQQVSPLGICEELSVQPEIPSLYNVPSLVSAFPNIFVPKISQSNAGASHVSSLSPDFDIDYTPSVFNSVKLSSPAYSQIDNQIIPLTSPTICPEFSSNTASSFPHTNAFYSYPNIHLPSSLTGPSLKPLRWPNIPTKYPVGSFLPPNILPTNLLPQANSWKEGISNNIIQEIPEFTPLSFSNDLTSIPRYYSPHISEALENLYDLSLSPKFNSYALIPNPHHDFSPYYPQTFPNSQNIENILSSFIPCPTSSYTPLPDNVLQAKPLATNPWFTLESDQPTSPQNKNVEAMVSQPSFKSTAYNSQVNNKEYLSPPKHNIDISSESPCESLSSHLTNPSLVSIIDAIPSTEEGVNSSAPISDISLSTDSFSELNTCSYTEIDVGQNNVNKSKPIKSDSINMELTISEANDLIPLSESGPCSEQGLTSVDQPNLPQNIGKSMIHDKLTTDLKITEVPMTNIPLNIKSVDNTNAVDTQNITPIQSEFIENNLKVNKSYKVIPPTTQLYENTNQYKLEAATDVLSLHQSSIMDDEINILPSSLIPGSSIVSNTQEMPPTFNIDVSLGKKSSPYTTLDTSHVIPIKSHTTLSSDLQPPSISDLEHSTSGSNDFIAKEFIPLDNIPFLDTTLEGSSLPSIISRPSSTQSSKYSISSIDRNMPHDSRQKSTSTSTFSKEYLKDSLSYQMLEESPPTYQYIPSSIDNFHSQSDFSGMIPSNQPPCNLQRPSTVSYLPLDTQVLQGFESQFGSNILPTYDIQDSNLPCNFPIHMQQKPETFETLIPYTLQPEHNFHSNNELSKNIPYNIPNIPENFVTLPYSESNTISNGLYPYRPLYSPPCGLGTLPSIAPIPPSFYNPQAIFTNLESNTPIYKPMFGLEKSVSEIQPCQQQVQPILAEEIPYSIVSTHIYQPAEVLPSSPCAMEKSTLSTSNIYLPTPFEISPSESLYSSEYLPPIVPPKISIPKLEIPSYPELKFRPSDKYSYLDTTSSSILNIPNNQYKIPDDIIKDSRYTLPDLESLGISNTPLVPISVSSPLNTDRFIMSSIAPQRNINPLKPPCRIPVLDKKLLTLPYARPESLTYTSLPYQYLPVNVRPASSSQPRYIQPISSSLTPKMFQISQFSPQYISPVSQSYYSLPVQPNFLKPQSTVTKPMSQAYLKPAGTFTRPQFSINSIPISPTYSTLSPAPTPILSASTGASRFTQFSTKPQFSVISSPCSQSYTTILPATAPILKPSTIPFTPSSTSITTTPCKKPKFSYKTPTPNYICPLSESYSYLPVTTNSLSPFIQPSTGIPKPYTPTPITPILSPKSNIVPQKYSALPAECINTVFLENKPIQKNPFIETKKFSPLPSYLPNQLYALPNSNILLKPHLQSLTFTHQATNRIPQNAVLYPKNIPKPEFIQHFPQSMMFSPPLNYAKPEKISIKGPLSISNNIYQESYETEKYLTKKLNINSMPLSSLKKYTPSSKMLYTTSGFGLPYSYPIVPGIPADNLQPTLSTTSSALTPCISASISLAPMLTSETLPNVLEYPYNMAPVDIRQKPLLVDKQPNRYDSALPSTLTPNHQEINDGHNPSLRPIYTNILPNQISQYNPLKLTHTSLSSEALPPSITSYSSNFVSQVPQLHPFTPASEIVSLPSPLLPNLPSSKLSSTSSSYIPPLVTYPVTYAEQVPGPLLPSTPSYIKYSTPMSIPANKSPLYYSSQKQMPISSQYLKPYSPLQIQELPINNFTPILRPCYSPFSVPSSTTSPFSNTDVKNPDLTRYLSPKYTTPQSTINNVVPTNEFDSTQIQETPISSQYIPCPLSPQDNFIEMKSPSIEPLVSESLICKESLDSLQTPLTNTMSVLPVSFNKDIQFTPITQPCSSKYQVDMPKELKDLLDKMSRPRPEVPNYQYQITYPFSKNLFGQILPQPIQDKPLSNLDVSEYQTLPLSAGISINQPTLQWLSATEINNLQNLISNPYKPRLPQYTISNSPIYGNPISSLNAPKIPNCLSSSSKPSYIPLSEPSSADIISSDLEYSDASQANPLTKAVPGKPGISPINKPLTCSYALQGTQSLPYFRQPSAKVPTELNISRGQGLPIQYPLKPTFREPKLFSLRLPFVGKNNQYIPFKPLPSSLQGPSLLGTEFKDIGTVPISNDVEWISAPLQAKNLIPQKAVLHPKNIPKPEFIESSPQPITFSPLLNTEKPANLAINEALFSSDNICQENFETGIDRSKILNIPLEESPIRIVEDMESIINENTKSNTVPIPISAKPYFNHQRLTPCSFKQLQPYSKLPYTTYTSGFGTQNSYQILPTQSPVEYTKAQTTVPIHSSSISPAESLTLLDVATSPSNIQPCSQIKPSQVKIDQPQLNIMPAYRQFIAPQFIPAIMSPYSYTSKLNAAENQLPIPSLSENKRPEPTYPYTTPDICINASPSQLQSPLSYAQPYILSDIQKLLGPIAKSSLSSPKYKNPVSYSSEIPSDFEVSSSSEFTPQYLQVNPYQPLLTALNKGLEFQATNYPHYLPCRESQSEGYDYVPPVPATTRLSPALKAVSSTSIADIPINTNEDILPNSLQNPKLATILGQYNLPSFISPYISPTQQYVPLNILSSSYIQPPSISTILSGRPQSQSYNAYPESLQSLSCQSMLPPKTQNWSSIPELVKSAPQTIQPNWWYQNGPIRAPFIKPNFENPYKFNTFTPYENIKTSSEITTPQYEHTISEGSYDYPKENTVYVNVDKYTEVPSNNELPDVTFKELEIENSVPTGKSKVYSDIKDYNEEYYTDVDLNPFEDLNNLQGPNPECKYSFQQPLSSAPFSKIVPEDFISALNVPNISIEDDSCKDSVIKSVELPPYVYNRNLPKYLPLNAVINKTGHKIHTCPISPIGYKTSSDEIQEPTPFELNANLNNAPNQGKYFDNNRFPNKPQELYNQPIYNPIPLKLYRNSDSPIIKPINYQYYPQLLPNFFKNTDPQTSKPQIASNAQYLFHPSDLDPDTLLVNSNDYSKVTPCGISKPRQVGNIKYSGYKTYQMPNLNPNTYQELPIMNEPKTTQTINNINSPLTPNLDFVNWQQSSNFNECDLNNLPVGTENEIKTNLINYLKQRDQKLGPDTKELTIPIKKFAIVKPVPCSEHTIKTKNPSLDLKVWKSNIKVVEAEIRLRFKDLSVINFMPIVNNLDDYDIEEIKKIVKDYINEKYGEHYDVNEPYAHNNEYAVIKELDKDFKYGKYNLLWPTKCVNA